MDYLERRQACGILTEVWLESLAFSALTSFHACQSFLFVFGVWLYGVVQLVFLA